MRSRIAATIIRPGDQQEGHCIGVGYDHVAAGNIHLTAFVHGAQDRAEFHARRFELVLLRLEASRDLSRGEIQKLVCAIASPCKITRSGAATVVWLSCERVNVA